MSKKTLHIALLLFAGLNFQSHADTVKILEWNVTGSQLNGNSTNQNETTNIFNNEAADIITLQETGQGADEIATILDADYDLAVSVDGQEIWIIDNGRFVIDSTGTWAGLCNGRGLDGARASIRDLNSNGNSLHVYSAHFCIPDTFAAGLDTNPAVSNEDQQEHVCNIVSNMEANATAGKVLIGADFNDINIPLGESIVSFLEGNGTLNAGFCTETTIRMTDVVRTDVTHIMGTGGPDVFSNTGRGNPAFGQHGYVVASIELDTTVDDPTPGFRAFSIDDRGGASLRSAGSAETVSVGYARIQPSDGETTPAGVAIFGLTENGILVTEAGVPAAALREEGRIFAEVDGPIGTGLAIANPNDVSATISFYFTDTDGTDFGSGSLTLGANQHISKFLNEDPFNGGESVLGTFTFTSSVPVAAIALRTFVNERDEFLITTLPVVPLSPESAETIYFPQYADGGGFTTEVVLVNPTNATISGTVQFWGQGSGETPAEPVSLALDDGSTGSEFSYLIPPRSSKRLRTANPEGAPSVGSVRVTRGEGTSSPSGVAVFSFKPGEFTVSEAGVAALPVGTAFRLYVEALGTPGQVDSVRSGLAITDTSSSSNTITLELTSLDGTTVGEIEVLSLPPSGHISKFLDELFSLSDDFSGVLRVTSSSEIAIVGLRGRTNERGDFLLTTTPPSNEADASTSADLFFPQIADSGGWTTQFVLFSGTAGQASSGTLSFLGPDGQVLEWSVN